MQVPLIRLECGCNSYDWGKIGRDSIAAKLAEATNFTIQDDKPYAELWMGTHPSLPSKDVETKRSLLDLVQDNKALMSTDLAERYGDRLPFLFKVLSMNKALSIQAHPNKKLAEKLHSEDSEHYPDDNHKPEMTVAITPFEGLCGFRPLKEIAHFVKHVAPLRDLIGDSKSENFLTTVKSREESSDPQQVESNKQVLQNIFSALMQNALASNDALQSATDSLVADAKSQGADFAAGGGPSPTSGQQLADLILRAHGQFPNDVGLLVFFFLNYVQLEPGEAMFLRADDIHAYLQGDIVECMASSDNVVRAGFTPKFKDVHTLTSMLTYNYAPIEEQKMAPQEYMFVKLNTTAYSSNSSVVLYDPPIEEFAVVMTSLCARGAKATFDPVDGPSIIVCTQGQGTIAVGPKVEEMKTGFVYFVGATAELVLESKSDDEFVTFKAFCELDDDQGKNGTTKNGTS